MAKIMLVEDDNNLREIYEARLLAEGYEIVAAKDGEEALALAVKERPDLIISDVMMPKISGFDMLDILRSTAETKDTKVIMMTALSQAEDKTRADKLGADRYLVKSQVTLEDVAKVARDVLVGDSGAAAAPVPATETPATDQTAPMTPAPDPIVTPTPVAAAPTDEPAVVTPVAPTTEEESTAPDPVPAPDEPIEPEPTSVPAPDPASTKSIDTSIPEAPVEPSSTTTEPASNSPDELGGIKTDLTQTTAQEEQAIENQINEIFAEPVQEDPNMVTTPAPGEAIAPPMPSVSPQLQVPEESEINPEEAVKTIDVTEAPDESVVPEVSTPPVAVEPPPEVIAPTMAQQTPADSVPTNSPDTSSVPIGGKKVISPINDLSKGPDINDLLQKEEDSAAVPPPPATSVVSPGGQTVVPVTTDTPADTKQPGNVISPNDIAL
jgi:CheY-like chemotaxis protein